MARRVHTTVTHIRVISFETAALCIIDELIIEKLQISRISLVVDRCIGIGLDD